jgi:hypothetical protein
VELVDHHLAPGFLELGLRMLETLKGTGGSAPHLGLAQRDLALAVALLGLRLARVGAAVALVIELADVVDVGRAPLFQIMEVVDRRGHHRARNAFEVRLAAEELQVVAGGPAAAVAPAEGQQARVEAVLLPPLAPAADDVAWAGLGVIVVAEVDDDLRAVDAFPRERVVRERVAAVVVPEDLGRGEVLRPAAAHHLRQRARVAEDVRQPEHLVFQAELLADEALAVEKLPDQALAAGDVRVHLDPRAAFDHDAARLHGLLHARVELRVVPLHHVVEFRLALQEAVVGVLLHQRERGGHRPDHLALGLGQRPEPGDVDVGVAEAVHERRRAAVRALEERGEPLAPGADGFHHLPVRQLEVHDAGEVAEGLVDLAHAQRVGVDVVAELHQRLHVHVELVDLLVPDAEGRASNGALGGRALGDGLDAVGDRPPATGDAAVPAVGLGQDLEALARRA